MGCCLGAPPKSDANGSASMAASDVLDVLRDAGAGGVAVPRMGLAPAEGVPAGARGDASGAGGLGAPCCCCAFCAAMLRAGLNPSCSCNRSSKSIVSDCPCNPLAC